MSLPQNLDIVPRGLALVSRRVCQYRTSFGRTYYRNCNSAWYRWGRWVLVGVLVLAFLVFLAIAAICMNRRRASRRRRAMTTAPQTSEPVTSYGNQPAYGAQQEYNAPQGPPPPNGYYGQQNGVAPPGQTYQPNYK